MIFPVIGSMPSNNARYGFYLIDYDIYSIRKWLVIPMICMPFQFSLVFLENFVNKYQIYIIPTLLLYYFASWILRDLFLFNYCR